MSAAEATSLTNEAILNSTVYSYNQIKDAFVQVLNDMQFDSNDPDYSVGKKLLEFYWIYVRSLICLLICRYRDIILLQIIPSSLKGIISSKLNKLAFFYIHLSKFSIICSSSCCIQYFQLYNDFPSLSYPNTPFHYSSIILYLLLKMLCIECFIC